MTDYYLKTDGSDAADGLSPANAWATFEFCLDSLSAGDTLYIAPGLHIHDQNARDNVGGTSGSPIVFFGDVHGEHFPDIAPAPVAFSNQRFDFEEAQSASERLFNWNADSKFFEFYNCVFVAGGNDVTEVMIYFGENTGAFGMDGIIFEDCVFLAKNVLNAWDNTSLLYFNYGDGDTPVGNGPRIRRCFFNGHIIVQSDDNAVANFDIDFEMESCVFHHDFSLINSGDNGTYNITGIRMINCSQYNSSAAGEIYSILYPRGGAGSQALHGVIADTNDVIASTAAGDTGCIIGHYTEAIGGDAMYGLGGGTTGAYGDACPPNGSEFSHVLMVGYEANWLWEKWFGFSPFLMWEPVHLFGLKNQAMGKGDPSELPAAGDYYGRPYDKNRESYVWAGFFNGDHATEPWNSQMFTPTDPDTVWSNETWINEDSSTQSASTSTDGDIDNNYLKLEGAAVNLDAAQVINKVYVRPYLILDGATCQLSMNFYTAAEAEDLGTLDFLDDSANYEIWEGPRWFPMQEIPAPSGGWTVAKMQGLVVRMWQEAGTDLNVYKVSLWIDSGDHDAGAVRAQGPRALEEVIVNGSPTSIKLVRGGMYQTTIPCIKDVPITVSADMYKDANYAGNAPSMEVFNIPGGVALQSDAMVGAASTWEYVNVSFTPTQNGMATIRFRSQCTADDGNCYFDNLAYV